MTASKWQLVDDRVTARRLDAMMSGIRAMTFVFYWLKASGAQLHQGKKHFLLN